jgi:glutamyl-tRNA synthetase
MAVVSDDIAMRITLVMRGDDHISNTPKQILLYEALDASLPAFAHVPMIHGLDGKKLSKRHGATAVADYASLGILPRAMVNFLALLGWSPGDDREVMTLEELTEAFAPDGLQRKAAIFDPKKLEWMNGQHLSLMTAAELEPLVTPALVASDLTTVEDLGRRAAWYRELLELLKVRARTVHDIVRQAVPYFAEAITYEPEAVAKAWKNPADSAELLVAAQERLTALRGWNSEELEQALREVAEARGVGGGKLFQPLRVALTGMSVSPGIFEVLVLMGREQAFHRLRLAIEHLNSLAPTS